MAFDRLFSIWQPLASDSMTQSDSDDETRDLRVKDRHTSGGVLGVLDATTVSTCCCDSVEFCYCTAAVTSVPVAAVRVERTPSPTAVVSFEPCSCSTIRYPKGARLCNSLLVRAALCIRCFSLAAVPSTASCCSEAPAQIDDAILQI